MPSSKKFKAHTDYGTKNYMQTSRHIRLFKSFLSSKCVRHQNGSSLPAKKSIVRIQ